jgi:hypothetical protein
MLFEAILLDLKVTKVGIWTLLFVLHCKLYNIDISLLANTFTYFQNLPKNIHTYSLICVTYKIFLTIEIWWIGKNYVICYEKLWYFLWTFHTALPQWSTYISILAIKWTHSINHTLWMVILHTIDILFLCNVLPSSTRFDEKSVNLEFGKNSF